MHAKVLLFAVHCNLYFDSHSHSLYGTVPTYFPYESTASYARNKFIVDTKITTNMQA